MLTMKRLVGSLSVAAAALFVATAANASTTTDQPAAVVIFPKIVLDTSSGTDTIIELANTDTDPVNLHCFYVNATSHCSNTGVPCQTGLDCGGTGSCVPGWAETDFSVVLTQNQPAWSSTVSSFQSRTCTSGASSSVISDPRRGSCDSTRKG